jgi:prevent-host-death family protein
MAIMTASDVRANLYKLIDTAQECHEPIIITGKRNNAVLVSEDDWKALQETLYLISIPGMKESIVAGMKESLSESATKIDW